MISMVSEWTRKRPPELVTCSLFAAVDGAGFGMTMGAGCAFAWGMGSVIGGYD